MSYRANDGRTYVDVSTNKTLTAADSGIVQNVIADGVTVTVPATINGAFFMIRNGGAAVSGGPAGTGANGTVGVTLTPNASDGITGNGWSSAVGTSRTNTKATSKIGDEIRVSGTGTTGATGWFVENVVGTWA